MEFFPSLRLAAITDPDVVCVHIEASKEDAVRIAAEIIRHSRVTLTVRRREDAILIPATVEEIEAAKAEYMARPVLLGGTDGGADKGSGQ